jgi:hypothetical protein
MDRASVEASVDFVLCAVEPRKYVTQKMTYDVNCHLRGPAAQIEKQ